MQLYLVRNGKSTGPYTVEQIHAEIAAGRVTGADYAWYQGLPAWTPLAQIPGVLSPGAPGVGGAFPAIPSPSPSKRPVMVWVISIFYFILIPLALLGALFVLIVSFTPQAATDPNLQKLHNLNAIDYVLSLMIASCNLCGAITLFIMRRAATYFFGAVLVLNPLSYIKVAFTGYYAAMETPKLVGSLLGVAIALGINLAVFLYVLYLHRSGRLR